MTMRQASWKVLSSVTAIVAIVALSLAIAASYAVYSSSKPPVYVSVAILQTEVTLPSVMAELPYVRKYADLLSEASGVTVSSAQALSTLAVISQTSERYLLQVRAASPEQAFQRASLALKALFEYVRPAPAALELIEKEELTWRNALAGYQRIVDDLAADAAQQNRSRVLIVQDHAAAVTGSQEASAALLLLEAKKQGLGQEIVAVPPGLPSEALPQPTVIVALGLFLMSAGAMFFMLAAIVYSRGLGRNPSIEKGD